MGRARAVSMLSGMHPRGINPRQDVIKIAFEEVFKYIGGNSPTGRQNWLNDFIVYMNRHDIYSRHLASKVKPLVDKLKLLSEQALIQSSEAVLRELRRPLNMHDGPPVRGGGSA